MPISAIDVINFVLPKDFSSHCVARDLAYGDEGRQKLDLYAPRQHGAGPLPVVVFFYGGSWVTGNRQAYAFVGRALAALGYLVAVPDYRVVPQVEYPQFLEDCGRAVSWIGRNARRFGGDPDRIVLAGHSAGAYNAAMLALNRSLIKDESVAEAIVGFAGLSGPYDFFPFDGPISMRVFGGVKQPKLTQPINHVSRPVPNLWVATGGRDELVLPRNSERLAAEAIAAGSIATCARYEALGHAGTLLSLAWPLRWRAPVLREMAEFLDRVFRKPAEIQAASLR
ncbi:MAG: alpha/beta hydrolase [Devosia sp.]|uniref:alpha/beta hydrolase n=1 Tax=Devosia sp. TaxID=1871048 RepID=UPI0024CD284E|nr:alpha/beta hydrolase [Devosia sp.]UYN98392.1 MAG: alpha/beta hydrolase [Devosia sp.]